MLGTGILSRIQRYGLFGYAKRVFKRIRQISGFEEWRCRNAPRYASPTDDELLEIEQALRSAGVVVHDLGPPVAGFREFQAAGYFPEHYHGGRSSGVWDEKLLEHWIAADQLDLFRYDESDVYVDVAAGGSPWARALRERHSIQAYAIDLDINPEFSGLDFYREENATKTRFADSSVRGMSLQCAFELFLGSDDINFIPEIGRILKPGGKAIILPLYMHTHHCAYSTPEFFGKGHSDPDAKEYVRMGFLGVPSSRKYDVKTLKRRVLDPITSLGMSYQLMALRNKYEFGDKIYCHFILEIEK